MRRTTLVLLLLGATACTQESSHADPPCAFDITGCVPFELVMDIRAGPQGPTAELSASSPTEDWVQDGVAGTGTEVVVPSTEPGRIAPRIEISIVGDAERADLRIVKVGSAGPDSAFEVVRRMELGPAPRVVRLDNGDTYVFHLTVPQPKGEAAFSFVVRVP